MNTIENQIKLLNRLITTLYDGEHGYQEAAKEVKNETLAIRLKDLAKQRYVFGHEIKPFIQALGGEVETGGSTLASIHRNWIDLKAAITSNDEAAILNECIRGEEVAISVYESVLQADKLSGKVRNVVEQQLGKIKESLTDIKARADVFATVY